MAINVKPLGDRVVQPLEEKEVKKGGIIIPDTEEEKPQEATSAIMARRSNSMLKSANRTAGPLSVRTYAGRQWVSVIFPIATPVVGERAF